MFESGEDLVARFVVSGVVEPGDPAMARLLASFTPGEVWAKLRAGHGVGRWVECSGCFGDY